jgi:hypothetical protein
LSEIASVRIGTLEITAALAAVALVSGRRRPRSSVALGRRLPIEVVLGISERGAHRTHAGLAPLEIGRDAEASLVLSDPEVSRRHARLEPVDGIIFLCDLESSNGTFLNGSRVTSPIEVRVGDEIDVGATRLTVEDLKLWT